MFDWFRKLIHAKQKQPQPLEDMPPNQRWGVKPADIETDQRSNSKYT